MRLAFLFIILIIAGLILSAGLFINNRTLSQDEMENVKTVCVGCHGQVPQYEVASRVHTKHAAFECGFCHRDNNAVRTISSLQSGLKWFGVGLISLGFFGIITNLFVVYRGRAR